MRSLFFIIVFWLMIFQACYKETQQLPLVSTTQTIDTTVFECNALVTELDSLSVLLLLRVDSSYNGLENIKKKSPKKRGKIDPKRRIEPVYWREVLPPE